jgi:hypothetical protein
MTVVVADTSPLNYLVRIEAIDRLQANLARRWVGCHRPDRGYNPIPVSSGNSSELLLRRLCDDDGPGYGEDCSR